MKKILIALTIVLYSGNLFSQDNPRVITTAVPFLLITPDARAAGMGDVGVATSVDTYSQQWNPAKYAFAPTSIGFGVSYTPYLSSLVNDIALLNGTFYNRINERSAWAASIKYFSLGDIELLESADDLGVTVRPNELAIDVSYALKLSDYFSMSVAGRYLSSDLKIQSENIDAKAAGTFAVDVSGFYQSPEQMYNSFDGRWRAGFNIQNIGPKIKYDDVGREEFIPTNLKVGAGFDFIFDPNSILTLTTEFNKLLVPTPDYYDENGNIDDAKFEDYQNTSFLSGMFSSFGDAPDGFSEELKEFTWALGAQYLFQEAFAIRAGYFNESEEKGSRKFFTLGAGFKFNATTIDISYLFSTSDIKNPLENTLRFSLSFNLGEEFFD